MAKNKKKPQRQNPRVAPIPRAQESVYLSECTTGYTKLLVDPFTAQHDACVPSPPAFPSEKLTCFSKGVLTTSTVAGRGFLLISPYTLISNDSSLGVLTTDGSFAGATFAQSGTGVVANFSNSPYATADVGTDETDVQYRLVAAGIRVRYNGTSQNRGGSIYGLSRPGDHTLVGFSSTEMLAFDEVNAIAVTDSWTNLTWQPSTYDYDEIHTNVSTVNSMGFMIECPSSQRFVWEAYAHYEVYGATARGKTPSHVDIQGANAVQAALARDEIGYSGWTGKAFSRAHKLLKSTAQVISAGSRVVGAFDSLGRGNPVPMMKGIQSAGKGSRILHEGL